LRIIPACIWDPLSPFDDALFNHPKQARNNGLEFNQLLIFGKGTTSILHNCFLIILINRNAHQNGKNISFYQSNESGIALLEGILEILDRITATLTAYSLASAL